MRRFVQIGLVLALASATQAQFGAPDPRDSIILESKTVAAGVFGHPAFAMKVYITNKDTLVYLTLALKARTISGTAYAVLDTEGSPDDPDGRVWDDVVKTLKGRLMDQKAENFREYDGVSPDRFLVGAGCECHPWNPAKRWELPNLARSAIWEIEFMSASSSVGQMEIDTTTLVQKTLFTYIKQNGSVVGDIPVNFVKSVITIEPLRGDMNLDAQRRPADLVLHLNCVWRGAPPPAGVSYCDLNCDGANTIADVVLMIRAVFREEEFPC